MCVCVCGGGEVKNKEGEAPDIAVGGNHMKIKFTFLTEDKQEIVHGAHNINIR